MSDASESVQQQQRLPVATHPSTALDVVGVERTSENLPDQPLTPHTSTVSANSDLQFRTGSTQGSEPVDVSYVSTDHPTYQGSVPGGASNVPVNSCREVVSESCPSPAEEVDVRRPSDTVRDMQKSDGDAMPGRMTWMLGDDVLESTSSADLLSQAHVAESVPRLHVRDHGLDQSADRTQLTLVDLAVEELIGARSPLANLPTETDIDALIDMLRASPASSKPVSYASTVSLNDVLDNDPDLESTVDLDASLANLVDAQFFDDADLRTGGLQTDVQMVQKSNVEDATMFRNTDCQGFDFGSDVFGGDRPSKDDAMPLTASESETRTMESRGQDRECIDETATSQLGDENELHAGSNEVLLAKENLPEDSLARSNEYGDVVDLDESELAVSRQCTLKELLQSSGDHVEHPVAEVASNLASSDAEYSTMSSASTCRRVEHNDIEDVQPAVTSNSSEQDAMDCETFGIMSLDSGVKTLGDIVRDRLKETGNARVQPIGRRRSLEWQPCLKDTPRSVVDVGKDNVTALTAYFEEVHADRCPGCQVCITGTVERPFTIHRRSSLPVVAETGFKSSGEFLPESDHSDAEKLWATDKLTETVDSRSTDTSGEPITAAGPLSESEAGRSQTLPANFRQTPTRWSQKPNHDYLTALCPDSPQSETAAESCRSDVLEQASPFPATSRRVVSLPDVHGESTTRSRVGQRQAEFRFRVTKVRSHSLRSFGDLTGSAIAKMSTTTPRPFEPVSSQEPIQQSRSVVTHGGRSSRKVGGVDRLAGAGKSSRSPESSQVSQASPRYSADQVRSADQVDDGAGMVDRVSLAEICSSSSRVKQRSDSYLTADMIQKYRIDPRRRVGHAVRRDWRPAADFRGRETVHQPQDDEVVCRTHGGLEQRIDAMLFDADRRLSDDDGRVRRNVMPRTTAPLPPSATAGDFNSSRIDRQVSQ